jgi:hypothetical protein
MSEPRTLSVGVVHCDLRQAQYPVAVGHHVGGRDRSRGIGARRSAWRTVAAAVRSRRLSGTRRDLGNRCSHGSHPGAIVVGLGRVGELTPERLRAVFGSALRL